VLADRLAGRFPEERAIVRANLARVVPGADGAARERLVAELFRNFAVCFADLLTTNRRDGAGPGTAPLARVEGQAVVDAALAEGRGAVVLTAHLGNWELAGRVLAWRHRRPTHVVVAEEADPGVERFLRGGPAPVRFVTLARPTAAVELVAALRRNEIVALQGDRALGSRGDVGVRFFGAEAPFPVGPFVLARAAGAPVVPAFCLLGRDRRYTISLGEPLRVRPGGERAALARWVAVLEDVVGRHPEQWFNFFDVWGDGAAG
jgi:lauroyl/myristoyl acyltransferase